MQLRLDGAPATWLPRVPGVELVDRRDGVMRLVAQGDVDPARVLAAAEQVAPVVEFEFGPPTLSELFLELVDR
jgi:ABC-type uncharacterized transport system ATPase subunit